MRESEAEFPKKFWEKLFEDNISQTSHNVSHTVLTRHTTDQGESKKGPEAGQYSTFYDTLPPVSK